MKRFAVMLAGCSLVACSPAPATPQPETSAATAPTNPQPAGSAAAPTTTVPTPSAEPSVVPRSAESAQPETPAKVQSGKIALSPVRGKNVSVTRGSTLTWSYASHGSVGKSGSCSVEGGRAVKFVSKNIKHDHPDSMKKGMTGADAGTGVYLFEAVAEGTARIVCKEEFRGDVKRTDTFHITVVSAR